MSRLRGITMAELIVTISLLLLGLSAVFANIRHTSTQGAGELARQVANELRNMRKTAMTTGNPRAFCIPTNNASTPIAQSYYTLRGHGKTLPRMVTDTRRQCPGTYLFVGMFGAVPERVSSLVHSSPSYPPVTPAEPPFLASTWMNPVVRDFAFIFLPDGTLATNDLPHDARGNTYLVVADGLDFTAAGPPTGTATMGSNPPPYFKLTAVNNCYTLKISSSGAISLAQGLPNPDPAIVVKPEPPAVPSLAAAPPPVITHVNTPPVVDKINASPLGNPANLPFETTVSPDGRVSLTMFAYDNDGDDLSYRFASSALDGTPPGQFTYYAATRRLQYPRYSAVGQARVDWVPPADVPLGARFNLDATVTDEDNVSVTSSGTVTVSVQVKEDGTIAFDSNGDVWTMKGDGTLPANKSRGGGGINSWPDISPDGKRIVFVSDRDLKYRNHMTNSDVVLHVKRIYTMNQDGSNVEALTNVDGTTAGRLAATKDSTDDCPCWSPNGSKVAFARTNAGVTKIQIVNADGSWHEQDLDEGTAPSWSRVHQSDDKDLVYEKGADVWKSDSHGTSSLLMAGASKPVWSPDGTRILYVKGGLMECHPDGSSPTMKFAGGNARVAFKPKGDHFVGLNSGALMLFTDPGLGAAASSTSFAPPSLSGGFAGTLSWALAR